MSFEAERVQRGGEEEGRQGAAGYPDSQARRQPVLHRGYGVAAKAGKPVRIKLRQMTLPGLFGGSYSARSIFFSSSLIKLFGAFTVLDLNPPAIVRPFIVRQTSSALFTKS